MELRKLFGTLVIALAAGGAGISTAPLASADCTGDGVTELCSGGSGEDPGTAPGPEITQGDGLEPTAGTCSTIGVISSGNYIQHCNEAGAAVNPFSPEYEAQQSLQDAQQDNAAGYGSGQSS